MTDLTKIFKPGDKVWDVSYGEVEVVSLANLPQHPILVRSKSGVPVAYTKDGRISDTHQIRLYPLDQKPAPPQWPEVPKTFEWEGDIYTEGEWVAVRVGDGEFNIRQLELIIPLEMKHPIKCSNGWVYSGMRKLTSFNQSEEKK